MERKLETGHSDTFKLTPSHNLAAEAIPNPQDNNMLPEDADIIAAIYSQDAAEEDEEETVYTPYYIPYEQPSSTTFFERTKTIFHNHNVKPTPVQTQVFHAVNTFIERFLDPETVAMREVLKKRWESEIGLVNKDRIEGLPWSEEEIVELNLITALDEVYVGRAIGELVEVLGELGYETGLPDCKAEKVGMGEERGRNEDGVEEISVVGNGKECEGSKGVGSQVAFDVASAYVGGSCHGNDESSMDACGSYGTEVNDLAQLMG